MAVEKCIQNQLWNFAAYLCATFKETLLNCGSNKIKIQQLRYLLCHLKDEVLLKNLNDFITTFEKLYPTTEVNGNTNGYQVESGIFVVSRPLTYTQMTKRVVTSNDSIQTDTQNFGMIMPFLGHQLLDPDFAHLGYEAIASIAATVSFDDLKSKYHSGKDKILTTMGQLEDKLKTNHQNFIQPLLDVRNGEEVHEDDTRTNKKLQVRRMHLPDHLQKFVRSSHKTWNKIPTIGHDRKSLISLLNHWVHLLNDTQILHHQYLSVNNNSRLVKSRSLENLSPVPVVERRNSCSLALKMWNLEDYLWWQNMFSKQNLGMNWNKLFGCSSWNLESNDELLVVGQLASLCLSNRVFGQISDFANTITTQDDFEDLASSLFIYRHFELLTPSHLKAELEKDNHTSTYKSWITFITCLLIHNKQRDFSTLVECFLMVSKNFSYEMLPKLLDKLTMASSQITVRDVLYLDELTKCNGNLLLSYMDETLDKQFTKACDDELLCFHWLKAILHNSPPPSNLLQCKCGTPKAGAHKYPWQRNDLLMQILRASTVNSQALEKCRQYGFWIGYMYVCNGIEMRHEALTTLVNLNDINLFEDYTNAALLPCTTDEWKLVFNMVNSWEASCKQCDESLIYESCSALNVEKVAEICIKYIDPQTCLQILPPSSVKFTSKFFRQVITRTIAKEKHRTRLHRTSSTANHFVWSQFRNYACTEIRSKMLNDAFATGSCPVTKSRDDFQSHWGINFDLKSLCSKCSLPLIVPFAEQSSTVGGIRVFQCGHSFHLFCIRNGNFCIMCRNS